MIEGRPRIVPSGVSLGSETVPLIAGAVHYWRLEPSVWRAALQTTRSLGFRLVDVYVPWAVHEITPGEFDLTGGKPERDIVRFLEVAREVGLLAIVRPGPHVNAELTGFGIPERVLWRKDCQALSASGKPVILPAPPLAFPVPSYASEAFFVEVEQWLGAVARTLAPLRWPDGPIVLVQIDNEGAMYFRDGVYDQDHHPDAISAYRRFLTKRYRRIATLREAHGDDRATFAAIEPPRRFEASEARDLTSHLDWAEFQELELETALARMRQMLEGAGLAGIPFVHNLPPAESATPLDPARLERVVDLIGLDYYHPSGPVHRSAIARRTTELASRAEARGTPAFASELAAGFPPFFPALTEGDNAFAAMTALAYGLRGFCVYMAVDRDRWIGAPIGADGVRRESAGFWERLIAAFERTRFHELHRDVSVRIVVPRVLRRLERVTHAFGPVSAAAFRAVGASAQAGSFEEDLGFDEPMTIAATKFLGDVERALEANGVPFAVTHGDRIDDALSRSRWVIVVSPGALDRKIIHRLETAVPGAAVSIGPRTPEFDEHMRPVERSQPVSHSDAPVPRLLSGSAEAIQRTVAAAITELDLPTCGAVPKSVELTVHRDAIGRPRVLFAINATEQSLSVRAPAFGSTDAMDALDGTSLSLDHGEIVIQVPSCSVRMLALSARTPSS